MPKLKRAATITLVAAVPLGLAALVLLPTATGAAPTASSTSQHKASTPKPSVKPTPTRKAPAPSVKPTPTRKAPAPSVKPTPTRKAPAPSVKPTPKPSMSWQAKARADSEAFFAAMPKVDLWSQCQTLADFGITTPSQLVAVGESTGSMDLTELGLNPSNVPNVHEAALIGATAAFAACNDV